MFKEPRSKGNLGMKFKEINPCMQLLSDTTEKPWYYQAVLQGLPTSEAQKKDNPHSDRLSLNQLCRKSMSFPASTYIMVQGKRIEWVHLSESSHLASMGKPTASAPLFSTRRNPLANKPWRGWLKRIQKFHVQGPRLLKLNPQIIGAWIPSNSYS
ncbi:hypothetical protein PAAG_11558 [Paracoccidioides lutzii Pb01]|uniref:Uncharacterized protein n=1 Tax=Paracoccidioides lutzii (strain ATCC MYA-826 / Pb01) TaxID=502779 RepID=A0A0A2V1S1_PARBA|nr:hypothetical protein PAAG_11558 [Paracoccidioides lutzii Pb01]KGQ01711.1 hypothetical protein PAAG_11558 [Paracoccidioides lutzii Pb01]